MIIFLSLLVFFTTCQDVSFFFLSVSTQKSVPRLQAIFLFVQNRHFDCLLVWILTLTHLLYSSFSFFDSRSKNCLFWLQNFLFNSSKHMILVHHWIHTRLLTYSHTLFCPVPCDLHPLAVRFCVSWSCLLPSQTRHGRVYYTHDHT